LSGLTFQEWDPSSSTGDTSAPVTMLVNSSELCATNFHLSKVSPLQLDVVTLGVRRTRGESVRQLEGVGNNTFVLSWKTTMTSGHEVREYLVTLGLGKSYFFKFSSVYRFRFSDCSLTVPIHHVLVPFHHGLPQNEVVMGTNSFFHSWSCQSFPAFAVYPPCDTPHMLGYRGTCHYRTQLLGEPCQVVKQNSST
jgi:hypothetical protein